MTTTGGEVRVDRHLTILGVLYIALGALGLLAAALVFAAVTGGGLLSGDAQVIAITSTVGTIFGAFLALISIPGIVAGLGLLRRRRWARTLTLVLSVLNLFNFPFGTLLGIYGLWVLTQRETALLLGSDLR